MLNAAGNRRFRPRAEHGWTLIELCVALLLGTVVIAGLFSVLIVTLRQTQRTFTKVDATRRARTALAGIENELHSACVDGSPPIQGVTNGVTTSDANNLVFISIYGTAVAPKPVWHQITFDPSGTGTLTELTYPVTGTPQNWTQVTTAQPNTTVLLTNVARVSGTTPVFRYYAYENLSNDASGNQYWTIPDGSNTVPIIGGTPNQPLATTSGLSDLDSNNVVEVVINLLVGPSPGGGHTTMIPSLSDSVTDAVSLRLTTPPNYIAAGVSASAYGPCQ